MPATATLATPNIAHVLRRQHSIEERTGSGNNGLLTWLFVCNQEREICARAFVLVRC